MEGTISSSPSTRIAVVTGGNKGIGLEVCRQLAASGVTVVLTARDETRGAAAVEKLREQGISDVIFHQLKVTNASSIASLADFLKTRFGRLDILVNNAAIGGVELVDDPSLGPKPVGEQFSGTDWQQRIAWMYRNSRETYSTAEEGLRTNYYGTKHVTEALLPLLKSSSDGNVSSGFGLLRVIKVPITLSTAASSDFHHSSSILINHLPLSHPVPVCFFINAFQATKSGFKLSHLFFICFLVKLIPVKV